MRNRYVLVLSYVDKDYMDIGGNIFPKEGFIKADRFEKNIDISNGLNGILWGKSEYLPYEKLEKNTWAVIKTEISDDLITVDKDNNRYKFHNGVVVYFGGVKKASRYITNNKHKKGFDTYGSIIKDKEIVGSEKWLKKNYT